MSKVAGAIVIGLWAGTAWAETVTIAALGDSLTHGYGLPVEQGFVPQLEAWLEDAGHDVDIINAGVSGDTTQGGLSRVDWTLTPEVDAMIVTLGGNDLLRGIDPDVSRQNLEGIVQAGLDADVEVLLVGMRAPLNYGPDYKQAFDAMFPAIASSYGTLHFEDFFIGLGGSESDPADVQAFMQPDGIHPNALGIERIVEKVGPSVEALIAQIE
ncbi:arylesterase [Tateyamaria omphalii]|uniref:arylesterase n=1 Tax=Tateyamaria omphalii TaxID=299262 RepID=UPI00167AD591|nr:arylesterase [Tateyamaria omphalii]GGX42545.1 arylesterase [Tateyamaria omphalii]